MAFQAANEQAWEINKEAKEMDESRLAERGRNRQRRSSLGGFKDFFSTFFHTEPRGRFKHDHIEVWKKLGILEVSPEKSKNLPKRVVDF